jgi:formate--tetrahydrofolate ligase
MLCADDVITEAGFGFDLGGEKFLEIKCRQMGIWPRVVVLVATLRALKMHGGAPVKSAGEPSMAALENGLTHLDKHLETAAAFGLPVVVALNVFPNDPDDELVFVERVLAGRNVRAARCHGFARGGEGGLELASLVADAVDATDAAPPEPRYLYEPTDPFKHKVTKIATVVYGAREVAFSPHADAQIARIEALGQGSLPACMAKTQLSLSDDPTKIGRPRDFVLNVREARLSAGAGFVVALTGEMMTMPGLPKEPSALRVKLLPTGRIRGLMQNDD